MKEKDKKNDDKEFYWKLAADKAKNLAEVASGITTGWIKQGISAALGTAANGTSFYLTSRKVEEIARKAKIQAQNSPNSTLARECYKTADTADYADGLACLSFLLSEVYLGINLIYGDEPEVPAPWCYFQAVLLLASGSSRIGADILERRATQQFEQLQNTQRPNPTLPADFDSNKLRIS